MSNYVDRLLYQYKSSPKFVAILTAICDEFDELAISRGQLLDDRTLETGIGAQLDAIGTIVGFTRPPGETDDRYRWILRTKIMINNADALVDKTISLMQFILGGTPVSYTLTTNLSPVFEIQRELTAVETTLINLIASPLGIEYVIGVVIDPNTAFSFFEDTTGLGFGDINNAALGGNFSFLI